MSVSSAVSQTLLSDTDASRVAAQLTNGNASKGERRAETNAQGRRTVSVPDPSKILSGFRSEFSGIGHAAHFVLNFLAIAGGYVVYNLIRKSS
jgi:hypothetical protein